MDASIVRLNGRMVGHGVHCKAVTIWLYNDYLWAIFPSNRDFAYAWGKP